MGIRTILMSVTVPASHARDDRCVTVRMPRCDHCGMHVSDRFARVFADEADRLYACPNCSANAGIAEVVLQRRSNG